MSHRTLDVVIATRNRPEPLARCLAALAAQTFRDFGVIVVDDASDPPIDQVVADARPSLPDIRIVRHAEGRGPAAARNTGVSASEAEFIAFVDDDVCADSRLLEVHLDAIRRSPAGSAHTASCGPFVQPADWRPTPWNLWEATQAKHEADSMVRGAYKPTWRQFHTGNNCLARGLFLEAGGFAESLKRAEDDELGLRLHELGAVFVFRPDAIAWHYSERSLEAWLAIPRAYAFYEIKIDELHPGAGYLARKQAELRARNPVMRGSRRVFRNRALRAPATHLYVSAARVLYHVHRTRLAMMALSAAYDLIYAGALADELRQRRDVPPDLALPERHGA